MSFQEDKMDGIRSKLSEMYNVIHQVSEMTDIDALIAHMPNYWDLLSRLEIAVNTDNAHNAQEGNARKELLKLCDDIGSAFSQSNRFLSPQVYEFVVREMYGLLNQILIEIGQSRL
jgi:vacuolar-type H+-ATPase subunit C/Vma6